MRSFVVIVCLIITWADAQNARGHQQDHSGWDIRLAVPGEPGNDYPTLGAIPRTSFSCAGKEPGYYADLETNCQVFRVCTVGSTYGFQSFLCPNGTLFNQAVFVCDWWMNVKCQNSLQLSNSNNEQFENLRLGPQLMKDIKKMLTYPMRNPYDKTTMRSNNIVMQDYKPPSGQLFPNGALLAGPERAPNNVYVPAKQIQQNFGQNSYSTTENVFAASSPEPRYIPAAFSTEQPSVQSDIEVFQRQQQSGQYIQSTQNLQSGNLISNGHARQFNQNKNTASSNNGNSQFQHPKQHFNQGDGQQIYTQRQTSKVNFQTENSQNSINTQRGQLRQRAQYSDNKQPHQLNSGKQTNAGISVSKQQYNFNSNQDKQPYTYRPPLPQFSNSINDDVGNEFKQNLALVYSFLADSINVAKEYSNTVQQESLPTQPGPQFQNLNNEELARITNNISELTSSQYSGTDKNSNNAANTMATTQTSTQDNQYRGNAKYSTQEHKDIQQIQPLQYIKAPSQPTQNQALGTQFQNNGFPSNILANNNQNEIYSGQLYQVPVPDVTSQIYNRQSSSNLIQSSNVQQSTQTTNPLRLNQNNNVANNNKLVKQSGEQVEVVQSQTLPLNPAKLQFESPNEPESFNSKETFTNLLNSDNGISAQLQDKIVGTIPHPLEENKLLTYKKDQSYFLFTKFENNDADKNDRTNNNQRNNFSGQQSAKLIQSNVPNLIAFQLIPSVSYQLEDEKEQQKLLNTFQIDEFGAPRNLVNSNQKADPRQDNVLTTNIDYTIEHPTSANQVDGRFNNINALYAGPSSYNAPQSSVGNLETRKNFNSRLEQFNENQNAGYTKMVPARQFLF